MKASKLVYNSNGWTSLTGLTRDGVRLNNGSAFGFEEWLNNPILKELKVGYIDSFRSADVDNRIDKIVLFTLENRVNYYVGQIIGASRIDNVEVLNTRARLINRNWLINVNNELNNIFNDPNAFIKYNRCFNSNKVTGNTESTFICNLKYESMEIFQRENWINISEMGQRVNSRWRHLRNLYDVYGDDEFMFEK